MVDLFWAYENAKVRDAGTFPPEPLDLAYGTPDGPPVQDLQRAVALGRRVTPADCGPVRVISRYGFVVRCPGRTVLRRAADLVNERVFTDTNASYGHAEVGGDSWPTGDSGFVASWISGSEYVKIQTGVMIFFPFDMYLYQGPLPNAQLLDHATAEVMAVHAQRRLATVSSPPAVHHQFVAAGTAYLDTLTPQVAVPKADSWVWEGDLGSAAGIADALVFRLLPRLASQSPLALIAAALADRAPLGRRAYAAVFVAYGAGLLRVLAEDDGSTALECSREWAALTIAYLDGGRVELRDGRLHLNDRDRPAGPGSEH